MTPLTPEEYERYRAGTFDEPTFTAEEIDRALAASEASKKEGTTAGRIFTTVTVGSALFAIGWGFATAGILGSLTGLVATVAVGSAFTIICDALVLDDSSNRARQFGRRFGGLVGAIGAGVGTYYGGWRMGWLYALLGYLLAFPSAIVAGLIMRRREP